MNSTNFQLTVGDKAKARCPDQGTCVQCGYISSQEVKRNVYSHRITHWYFSKNPNPRFARPACSWPVWTKGCHSWGSARVASIGKWWWCRWWWCRDYDPNCSGRHLLTLRWTDLLRKERKLWPPSPFPNLLLTKTKKADLCPYDFFHRVLQNTCTCSYAWTCLFFREECIVAYNGWRQRGDFLPSGLSRTSIVLSDWKISINTDLLFYWSDGHGPHKTVQVSMAPIRLHKTHLLHC